MPELQQVPISTHYLKRRAIAQARLVRKLQKEARELADTDPVQQRALARLRLMGKPVKRRGERRPVSAHATIRTPKRGRWDARWDVIAETPR